jgi:hypothetical protein
MDFAIFQYALSLDYQGLPKLKSSLKPAAHFAKLASPQVKNTQGTIVHRQASSHY